MSKNTIKIDKRALKRSGNPNEEGLKHLVELYTKEGADNILNNLVGIGGTPSVGNGLNINGTTGDINLGGTLIENTIINQDGNEFEIVDGNFSIYQNKVKGYYGGPGQPLTNNSAGNIYDNNNVKLFNGLNLQNGRESIILSAGNGTDYAYTNMDVGSISTQASGSINFNSRTDETLIGAGSGAISTSISTAPTKLNINTPNVNSTATVGQVLTLMDANTGEVEYQDLPTGGSDTTFADTDLAFTENRLHTLDGNSLNIENNSASTDLPPEIDIDISLINNIGTFTPFNNTTINNVVGEYSEITGAAPEPIYSFNGLITVMEESPIPIPLHFTQTPAGAFGAFNGDSDYNIFATNSTIDNVLLNTGTAPTQKSYISVSPDNISIKTTSTINIEALTGIIKVKGLPIHADEASATTAGLQSDQVYKTSTGELRIKL